MKKTRCVHHLYKEWQKLPKDIRFQRLYPRCIVGKWHYHYENKNGKEIGLVRFNHNIHGMGFSDKAKQHHYEACGTLDFERFSTLSQAEEAIYKKLGEKPSS